MVGRNNIFREKKKTNKVREIFFEFKVLTEREQLFYWTLSTNKPSKVCIYLAFKNLKSRGKKVQHWSQSLKESTNDVFVA